MAILFVRIASGDNAPMSCFPVLIGTMTGRLPSMNKQPSFARCVLHVRAIHRNPSGFRFYVCGIARELFTGSFAGLFILGGIAFICFALIVNSFFQ